MTPYLKTMDGTTTGSSAHAHLLMAESGGLVAMESPQAVMAEVEFRATHLSSLMEEMFEEAGKKEVWDIDEP
jgi:hypothetical protein